MADDLALLARQARLLAWGTNAWHVVEFAVAVASGIEALAGFVVIWRFTGRRTGSALAGRRLPPQSTLFVLPRIARRNKQSCSDDHPATGSPRVVAQNSIQADPFFHVAGDRGTCDAA
jgi:hypothetical protein